MRETRICFKEQFTLLRFRRPAETVVGARAARPEMLPVGSGQVGASRAAIPGAGDPERFAWSRVGRGG